MRPMGAPLISEAYRGVHMQKRGAYAGCTAERIARLRLSGRSHLLESSAAYIRAPRVLGRLFEGGASLDPHLNVICLVLSQYNCRTQ